MSDDEGRRLGSRYHIDTLIGRGGMGEVWRGTDETGTPVAIKTLQPQFADDPGIVQRFVAERHLLTSARDPHVVRVRDLVAEGSTLAIVMDLVPGGDLRALLTERGTLEAAEACRLAAQIASGLAAIHAAGIVHRDIKPENVLLDHTHQPPRAMLTDFGVAKIVEDSPARTQATVLAGTPMYLAPELALGMAPGPSADIYSLGILLYELHCGLTPFTGLAPGVVLHAKVTMDPGRSQGLDEQLWNLLAQLLNRDPARRPAAAAAALLLEHLSHALDGQAALEPLTVPAPLVPTSPSQGSFGRPAGDATQMVTPPHDWQPSPIRPWDSPTVLGRPAGQAGDATSRVGSVPGFPGQSTITPGQQVVSDHPIGPSRGGNKRTWLLPVILSTVAVLVAAAAIGVMIGLRGQSTVAAPMASGSPSVTPTETTTPAPAITVVASMPATVEARPEAASSLPTGVGPYADGFVRAWGIGDSLEASRYATDDAVAALFGYDARGSNSWAYTSTTAQNSRSQIRYSDDSGRSLYVVVDNATVARGAAHAVVAANVEVDTAGAAINEWPAYPGPVSLGDTGEQVRRWQDVLIVAGIISDVPENHDGVYGNATEAAVRRYLSGLRAANPDGDGNLGPNMYDLITR